MLIMMKNKLIYTVLFLALVVSCSKERGQNTGDNAVRIFASVENDNAVTRSGVHAPAGAYHLFLPLESFNSGEQIAHRYVSNGNGSLTTAQALHWDDIAPDPLDRGLTEFYLTNHSQTEFEEGISEDILWGKASGWLSDLNFTLTHSMSRLTFELEDNTLAGDVDFSNGKVEMTQGLFPCVHGFDLTTGQVYISSDAEREETMTLRLPEVIKEDGKPTIAVLKGGIVPPQEFAAGTELVITAGKYIYRTSLPAALEDGSTPTRLNCGEHLTIKISLTEEKITVKATLKDWEDISSDPIDVNRVFNISNWNELNDLILAINTGYTFKGMVVRLTEDIEVQDQISLGTSQYPFEGIFDGNGHVIRKIGAVEKNDGGLFGYTNGATIQNITLEAPIVQTGAAGALGALVDRAENTTFFNCRVTRDPITALGEVRGSADYTGGLAGLATGATSFINCYTIIPVRSTADYVGGLVGYSEGSINHCSAQGEVTAESKSFVGGLAGYTADEVITSFAWGEVKGGSKVGGLVGNIDGLVTNSYAEGPVRGTSDFGGLFGSMGFYGDADYCFWKFESMYEGTGSATLNSTCASFDNSSQAVAGLNTGYPGVWTADGSRAIFTNQ